MAHVIRWEHAGDVRCISCNSTAPTDIRDCPEYDKEGGYWGEEYSCRECCECNGHRYEDARIRVFCDGPSCGLTTTMEFEFGGHPDFDYEWADQDWIDDRVKEKLDGFQIDGQYLCELCSPSPDEEDDKIMRQEERDMDDFWGENDVSDQYKCFICGRIFSIEFSESDLLDEGEPVSCGEC